MNIQETARFAPSELIRLASAIARGAGVPKQDAAILADALVNADLHGTSTHGLSRLNIYIRRMQKGLIDPRAKLVVDRRKAATLALDGQNGLGQVQAVRALEMLSPLAREFGAASATVRRSQHFGAASYYCNLAAEQGQILIAMTNCEPAMSPAGGCQAFFGTNPIAASFPCGKGWPVKVDLATSIVARGNIIAAQKQGKPIPVGWALTPEGEPTTDAAAALAGTVLTMAGHKGYALALMVEALAGVLSGAAVGPNVGSMYKQLDRPQDVGHFFVLLDIEAFMGVDLFKERMDATIDGIKACRRRPGVEQVLVPGERSFQKGEQNTAQGIALDETTRKELEVLCQEFGIRNGDWEGDEQKVPG